MAQVPVGLRLDEDLLARLDVARGDVPRARWVARAIEAALVVEKSRQGALAASRAIVANPAPYSRAAVETAEQALSDAKEPLGFEQPGLGSVSPEGDVRPAAPAEQSYRSSSFAKRDVRPVPKRGG